MSNVPNPPPIGSIVKSYIEYEYEGETYPVGSLFELVSVGKFSPQGARGYWAVRVRNIETHVEMQTYDDYFKRGHLQRRKMDVVSRPCIFP